jgi:hypothetical protein
MSRSRVMRGAISDGGRETLPGRTDKGAYAAHRQGEEAPGNADGLLSRKRAATKSPSATAFWEPTSARRNGKNSETVGVEKTSRYQGAPADIVGDALLPAVGRSAKAAAGLRRERIRALRLFSQYKEMGGQQGEGKCGFGDGAYF